MRDRVQSQYEKEVKETREPEMEEEQQKAEEMMTRAQKARKEVVEKRKSIEMETATEKELQSPEGLFESLPKKQRIGHEDQNGMEDMGEVKESG